MWMLAAEGLGVGESLAATEGFRDVGDRRWTRLWGRFLSSDRGFGGRSPLPQVVASVQVPSVRCRPRTSSRRRLIAAVRWCSQALFFSTPR